MALLKQLITYVVLLCLVVGAVLLINHMLSRAQVASDYTEIDVPDVEHYPTYALHPMALSQMHSGDVVCYRLPKDSEGHGNGNGFAWIAGTPGDTIAIAKGVLLVNGEPWKRCPPLAAAADCAPFAVPLEHLFVITTTHLTDSIARGPMPAAVIQGEVESFP
jgi:hypothetical protein